MYLLDDAGRIVSTQRVPGGGRPSFRLGSDGRTVYATVEQDDYTSTLWTYARGRFTRTAGRGGWYPRRLESGGVVHHGGVGDVLVRDLPRARATTWPLPDTDPYLSLAKSDGHGDDRPYGEALLVATLAGEPVAVHEMLGRCTVTDFAGGRQGMVDPPPPYLLRLCGDAVVDPDGDIAVLARDAGDWMTERRDETVLVTIDPLTLAERRRVVLRRTRQMPSTDFPGRLVALPGGLAAVVRGGRDAWYVADLRGAKPVLHRTPYLGFEVAAAGPDALYVWDYDRTVSRVTVSTGRVERDVLRVPGHVTSVLRIP